MKQLKNIQKHYKNSNTSATQTLSEEAWVSNHAEEFRYWALLVFALKFDNIFLSDTILKKQ